ncbi:MAG: ferrochelatase [Candidatus Zixiibacteriota bacterium]
MSTNGATGSPDRGILLVNLGSPDSASVPDVRRYLNQFLMDSRVIDAPYLIRRFIVSAFILPKRPHRSAEAYRSIWWKEGSPLVVISRRVQSLLQSRVTMPVGLGMRYGNPSIEAGLAGLLESGGPGLREVFLIPLYPHYAMSTYETVEVEARGIMKRRWPDVKLTLLPPFYEDPLYVKALVESARPALDSGFDHLLFSYHGVPERHLRKSDPTKSHCLRSGNCCETPSPALATCYRAHVFRTSEAFLREAGIAREKASIAFQSRLGRDPWLQPFTDTRLRELGASGVKRLCVICPSFVSDCLETLEEIGIEGRETFHQAGGEEFKLIPCLNEHPLWIEALARWATHPDATSD